jgi:hypothetical protein
MYACRRAWRGGEGIAQIAPRQRKARNGQLATQFSSLGARRDNAFF